MVGGMEEENVLCKALARVTDFCCGDVYSWIMGDISEKWGCCCVGEYM